MKQDPAGRRNPLLEDALSDFHSRHAGGGSPAGEDSGEDRVYRVLFDSILEHRLTPGMKLKEVPLAEAFGVTRGVIRKALTRLAALKLVSLRANHGAAVANPSRKEANQIFEARRLVEIALIERLAGTLSARRIEELHAFVRAEQDSYDSGDMRSGIWLSMGFHIKLGECADNRVLSDFLERLVVQTPLIFLADGHGHPGRSCSAREHTEIIDAIASGDPKRAAACMDAHLRHVEQSAQPRRAEQKSELSLLLGLD
ncbi:GntR family transcriptional regulator [Castellaniella sp. GW247-6E4]|uniref:GntR family transcriptional regulator n=1 Tax=Castellaniella sp. GW247-6E4 TaxID=3140380 RepID=UPI00331500A9